MKNIFLCLIAGLLIVCACTKTTREVLPPAQTGANTFGCVLNGQVFVPNEAIGTTPQFAIAVYGYYENTQNYSKKIFVRRGYNRNNIQAIYLYLYQIDVRKAGEYNLGNAIPDTETNNQPFHNYILCFAKGSSGEWGKYGSYDNSGKIIVTRWDKDNMILFGTFSGKLKQIDGEEIIEIKTADLTLIKENYNEK